MAAHQSAGQPDARTDRAPHRGRRHPSVRWIANGVLFVALVAGVFGLLPRLGGLTRDAAGLRHARPAFLVAAIVAQALSLGCYAQLYRRVLAALGPRMLELAAARSVGAHPYFVPVEHTARAREIMGPGPLLAPEVAVVLETDPAAVAEATTNGTMSGAVRASSCTASASSFFPPWPRT